MNYKIVRYVLGRVLQMEALLMVFPLIVSFVYKESSLIKLSYAGTILLLLIIGSLLALEQKNPGHIYAKEGLVIVSLSWILMSFFGAIPYVVSGEIPSMVDAFFEIASGFTTTGSSILNNVEALSFTGKFWRSFTHWAGGMGVLVFVLAVMPRTSSETVHIMKAEVPGPIFGKMVSRIRSTAQILYIVYLVMTAILVILLMFGGMNLFESLTHAFGAAGTGGFGIWNNSVAHYQSTYIHNVLSVAMILFGINFNLYFLILIGHAREALSSEELKAYLSIIIAAILIICINVMPMYSNPLIMIRDVFFTVSSVMTTTGYSTADFGTWPLTSHLILLTLMFIGACSGSTAGGLKVSRIVISVKSAFVQFRKSHSPNRVLPVIFENKSLTAGTLKNLANYIYIYAIIFFILLFIVSFDTPDFLTAFSAVAATFNNIGPGLGAVGPSANYSALSDVSKLFLSFGMLAGRLELFPMLVLLSPQIWKRHM